MEIPSQTISTVYALTTEGDGFFVKRVVGGYAEYTTFGEEAKTWVRLRNAEKMAQLINKKHESCGFMTRVRVIKMETILKFMEIAQ